MNELGGGGTGMYPSYCAATTFGVLGVVVSFA
jgi:hypothetical protein